MRPRVLAAHRARDVERDDDVDAVRRHRLLARAGLRPRERDDREHDRRARAATGSARSSRTHGLEADRRRRDASGKRDARSARSAPARRSQNAAASAAGRSSEEPRRREAEHHAAPRLGVRRAPVSAGLVTSTSRYASSTARAASRRAGRDARELHQVAPLEEGARERAPRPAARPPAQERAGDLRRRALQQVDAVAPARGTASRSATARRRTGRSSPPRRAAARAAAAAPRRPRRGAARAERDRPGAATAASRAA